MWGAMQGAEVRKDLLEADARDRKSQCRSSGEKIAGDMAIFTCPNSIRVACRSNHYFCFLLIFQILFLCCGSDSIQILVRLGVMIRFVELNLLWF